MGDMTIAIPSGYRPLDGKILWWLPEEGGGKVCGVAFIGGAGSGMTERSRGRGAKNQYEKRRSMTNVAGAVWARTTLWRDSAVSVRRCLPRASI